VFRVLAVKAAGGWACIEIVQGGVDQVGVPQAITAFVTITSVTGLCK